MNPYYEFFELIRNGSPSPQKVKAFLDAQDQNVRKRILYALNTRDMELFWELADGFLPLAIEDLVPESTPVLSPVCYAGKNSLGIPTMSQFRKKFYHYPDNHEAMTFGRNFQWSSFLTGPGYFKVLQSHGERELTFDYSVTPTQCPTKWGEIRGNGNPPEKWVYGNLLDSVRKLSNHFLIGRATKHNKFQGLFVLCREETE